MAQKDSEKEKVRIVVKRISDEGGGHHGGAWKIAYADFVTAMMAFFLLMWLLGSVGKYQLQGIEDYFKNPKAALEGKAGATASVLQGGGTDSIRSAGAQRKSDSETQSKRLSRNSNPKAATAEQELKAFEELKAELENAIEKNPEITAYKHQLKVDMTPEGLRIQIIDDKQRAMFDVGSDTPKPYTKVILRELAKLLNKTSAPLSIGGHTDARQYSNLGAGYSNWELSSDRANASRRELVAGGIDQKKILRVTGFADSTPFNKEDSNADSNRRISIILLSRAALEKSESLPTADLEVQENTGTEKPVSLSLPPSIKH